MKLNPFGVDATILVTLGSISISIPDGEAIIGDVIMGGYVAGIS